MALATSPVPQPISRILPSGGVTPVQRRRNGQRIDIAEPVGKGLVVMLREIAVIGDMLVRRSSA